MNKKNNLTLFFIILIFLGTTVIFLGINFYREKTKPAILQVVPGTSQSGYPCGKTFCIPTPIERRGEKGFFQVKEGDVYAGGRLIAKIPETLPSASRFFNLGESGGLAISSTDLGIDLGKAISVSLNSNWQIDGYEKNLYAPTFNNFKNLLRLYFIEGKKELKDAKELKNLKSGAYYIQADLEIKDEDLIISGDKKLAIFVGTNTEPKDLKIEKDIKIPAGDNSVIIFIVSKNILISPEVKELHGFFYAAGIGESDILKAGINTGTKKPAEDDSQLVVYGSLIAGQEANINLERDLGNLKNQNQPGEIVILEPRYFVFLPFLFRRPIHSWQEVAP